MTGNQYLNKSGIKYLKVKNLEEGIETTKDLLYENCNKNTVLFLSGGSTPKPLYEKISTENKLKVGAVAIVDERFGKPMHKNSNEKMIKETGLLEYFKKLNIRFFPVLQKEKSQTQVAKDYDETVHYLLCHFKKSIGILGIGEDGHTAGIASNRKDFKNPMFINLRVGPSRGSDPLESLVASGGELVGWFDDENGPFKKRTTMTFNALSMLDLIIVLVFGKEKKKALKKMFREGSFEEIPARFFIQPEIAKKALLITDQKI